MNKKQFLAITLMIMGSVSAMDSGDFFQKVGAKMTAQRDKAESYEAGQATTPGFRTSGLSIEQMTPEQMKAHPLYQAGLNDTLAETSKMLDTIQKYLEKSFELQFSEIEAELKKLQEERAALRDKNATFHQTHAKNQEELARLRKALDDVEEQKSSQQAAFDNKKREWDQKMEEQNSLFDQERREIANQRRLAQKKIRSQRLLRDKLADLNIDDMEGNPDAFEKGFKPIHKEAQEQKVKRDNRKQGISRLRSNVQSVLNQDHGIPVKMDARKAATDLLQDIDQKYANSDYYTDASDGEQYFREKAQTIMDNQFEMPDHPSDLKDKVDKLAKACREGKIESLTSDVAYSCIKYIKQLRQSAVYMALEDKTKTLVDDSLHYVEKTIQEVFDGACGAIDDDQETLISEFQFIIKEPPFLIEAGSHEVDSIQKKIPNTSKDDQSLLE